MKTSLRGVMFATAILCGISSQAVLAQDQTGNRTQNTAAQQQEEHPMMPALRWANGELPRIEKIEDYTCTLVKRELVDGELTDHQYMFMKVRHQPFSVYMYFLAPSNVKGQEALYVDGAYNNKLQAHGTGLTALLKTFSLDPKGPLAMKGNRYPITEVGILNLVKQLIEVGEHDSQYGECEVRVTKKAKVNDRICTMLEFTHPVPRREFRFHIARIFIDDEMNLPIRYEAYGWPKERGGKPVLLEEYTYVNLKLNQGLKDIDFSTNNPDYAFK